MKGAFPSYLIFQIEGDNDELKIYRFIYIRCERIGSNEDLRGRVCCLLAAVPNSWHWRNTRCAFISPLSHLTCQIQVLFYSE